MSIYGVNGSNFGLPKGNEPVKQHQERTENYDIGNALRGAGFESNKNKTQMPKGFLAGLASGLMESISHKEELTKKDRKAWIKNYQETHNCSKKEAKNAFEAEFEKLDKMSQKTNVDAKYISKNWRLN